MNGTIDIIKCPTCGGNLQRVGKSLVCGRGHTFDVAKSGYVNMLPPGKEKNARSGDEKTMVRARVDFLAKGFYSEISETLAQIVAQHVRGGSPIVVCDMGCGEGYHTCNVTKNLHRLTGEGIISLGFDASKYAAECASKLSRSLGMLPHDGIGGPFEAKTQAYFMPANIFSLPLADNSVDVAVSMFAPIAWDEVRRILKDGGILAVVSSGREHLREMRELIYDEVNYSDSLPCAPDGFVPAAVENLTYTAYLTSAEDIINLFMMTPFYYKTAESGRSRLFSQDKLNVTVDVNISIFRIQSRPPVKRVACTKPIRH